MIIYLIGLIISAVICCKKSKDYEIKDRILIVLYMSLMSWFGIALMVVHKIKIIK